MHDLRGQVTPGSLRDMLDIVKTTLAEVLEELETAGFQKHTSIMETVHPTDRDKFMNLGAMTFICGMFVVLMSSNVRNNKHEAMVNRILKEALHMED